ncbi:elongation factor 1-alpha, somatic form [Pelomyxa schiedti]|nr:elongation factor 1-alpha, somatic form [Pelomyxa schiedti]
MAQWYNGPTLMEALDLVEPPTMPIEKPLRISIEGAYMISGVGTVAVGIVESGVLRPGMTITLAPDNITAQVKSIEMNHEPLAEAMPRDDIGFNLKNVEVADIRRGAVTGDADNNPPSSVSSFLARVTVLPHGTSIRPGFSPLIHCHAARFACRFAELQAKIDYHSGKVLQHNPTYIRPGDSAIVLMIPMRPVSVEPFTEHPRLGTIIVHNMSRVVALGTIMSVTKGPCIIALYNKAKGKAKGNRDSNH